MVYYKGPPNSARTLQSLHVPHRRKLHVKRFLFFMLKIGKIFVFRCSSSIMVNGRHFASIDRFQNKGHRRFSLFLPALCAFCARSMIIIQHLEVIIMAHAQG